MNLKVRSLADLSDKLAAFADYGVETAADALDPLLVNDAALAEDTGLTASQVQAFRASLKASKK